ncbi:hypothetical protein ALC57_11963 [Trachymyrmex cornetzi]|uniref:Uncharacterized protein n=1 Tax=Trachymyrmex cornetzi TaxID=471704 RepID=A0A151J1Q1_9HYME|nr:hypothetical protein ALC57_11963 [Trachymyrmex cornetzi]
MFDKTTNCVGDIFLHKYALLHVSYYSYNRKQSGKVKVKVTKSKIDFSPDNAAGQLACLPKFTNFEMADMHFAYGLANGNSRLTKSKAHPETRKISRTLNVSNYVI